MSVAELRSYLQPVVEWRLEHHAMFLFEVDTDALAKVLPAALDAAEVRPGISLVGIECLHYETEHFGPGYRQFDEFVLAASVQPNLGLAMPMPKYCIHGIAVISNSPEFVDDECRPLFAGTEYAPNLRFEVTQQGLGRDVYDGDVLVARCESPVDTSAVTWEPKTMWGQYYSDVDRLRQGIWHWRGELFEHMKRGADSTLFPHSFFRGLDLSRVRGCYRQLVSKPGTTSVLTRWLPGVSPDPSYHSASKAS